MAKRIDVVQEVLEEIIGNDPDADRFVEANGFNGSPFFAVSFSYRTYFEESEICIRYVTTSQPTIFLMQLTSLQQRN